MTDLSRLGVPSCNLSQLPEVRTMTPRMLRATSFVLWFRERAGLLWQMLATFSTEREAWQEIERRGPAAGEFCVLPVGREP
jgi:hypothetical protein